MSEGPDEQTARARQLIAERKYEEAIRVCRQFLLTRPNHVEIRLLLGEALLAARRYEQARVEMMALSRKHPNVATLHRILGEAYLRSGQTEKARQSLQRAIELDPRNAIARELLEEAIADAAPVSHTIERWLGDVADKTVEQDLPPFTEEPTPVPRPLPADGGAPPTVEVDPTFATDALALGAVSNLGVGPPTAPHPLPETRPTTCLAPTDGALAGHVPRAALVAGDASSDAASGERQPLASTAIESESDERSLETTSHELPIDTSFEDDTTGHVRRPHPIAPLEAVPTVVRPLVGTESISSAPGGELDPARLQSKMAGERDPVLLRDHRAGAPTAALPRTLPPPSPPRAPPPRAEPPRADPPRSAPPPPLASVRPPIPAPVPSSARSTSKHPLPSDTIIGTAPRSAASAPRPFLGGGLSGRSTADSETPGALHPTPLDPEGGPHKPAKGASAPPFSTTEITRRVLLLWRDRRAIGIAIGAAVVAIALGVVSHRWLTRMWAREAIRAAVANADADGRQHSIHRALATIADRGSDEPWQLALRARLLATLTLEHEDDRTREAEAALAALGRDADALPDAIVARALLLVAHGQSDEALRRLAVLPASDAETFRARAWAAWRAGQIAEAEQSAADAVRAAPGSPRHVALFALLRHLLGDSATALQVLQTVPHGETSPAVCAVRARILVESMGDAQQALADAGRVIDELAPTATATELGWAYLVRAQLEVGREELDAARADAQRALERGPTGDEHFVLTAVSTLLAAGAPGEARTALARLPSSVVDPMQRALVSAEVALANGDLATAGQLLPQAGAGPRVELLRGRYLEALGAWPQALDAYHRAATHPALELEARVGLASMLLRQSRAREAMTQLSQMLRTTRPGSGVVMLYVRAALAAGDFHAADTAIAEALRQSPDSPELTAARGLVQLARGQIDEGLAALQRASDARPHDVSLRIELGEAALRVGRLAVASQAFGRVLEISPTSVSAHIGLARVAMDEARFADAESAIVAAEQHGAPPLEVARLRAALSVARGLGASGVPAVREALERLGRDPLLNASMGELQLQAEEEREAESSFGRALNQDRDLPEALLGRAMLEIGRSRLGPATRLLDHADRAARERGRPASMLARLQVARGWVSFDRLHLDEAQQLAERALQLDPRCGDAHWLLANIALERRNDPTPHLRAASLGTRTPPEALAQLAIRLRSGNEACDIARRYVAAAPHGYDRRNVEEVLRRCR